MPNRSAVKPRWTVLAVVVALMFVVAQFAVAQDTPTPKAEIFGGYSWYTPGGDINGAKAPDLNRGWGAAGTWNLNRFVGLTADFGGHYNKNLNVHTFLFGPQLRYRTEQVSPFVELLGGFSRQSPDGLDSRNAPTLAAGGGLDLYAGRNLSIRIFQADFMLTNHETEGIVGSKNDWHGARLQGGLVLKLGVPPLEGPVSATCAAQPNAVMAGEPVQVTITPTGFLPKRTLSYSWSATGGKAEGTAATTNVDTTGLAPGQYTVTGTVTDNGKGKHQQSTKCTANFTVNEPPKHPPTITCNAGAQTVRAGDPVTITCQGNSPDNRPLTYQWNSSAGRVSGTGPTATLDTAGAQAGPITITTTVSDDRNLTASAETRVNVEVPPPPPTASRINAINFPDTKRPARVDNAAKAVLDDVALRLQREADAKAVIVGFGTDTKRQKNLAANRAINTKAYLVDEKGIDPSRIEVRTGTGDRTESEIWIVPTGATFTGEGTNVVNESAIKAPARKGARR